MQKVDDEVAICSCGFIQSRPLLEVKIKSDYPVIRDDQLFDLSLLYATRVSGNFTRIVLFQTLVNIRFPVYHSPPAYPHNTKMLFRTHVTWCVFCMPFVAGDRAAHWYEFPREADGEASPIDIRNPSHF